jgi:hypothetical protein
MKISNVIVNLGRVVAFYPGLKVITGSTTSSILLCQLLYWSNKTRDDGWIYKDRYELIEETGLTYNEQLTAKKALSTLGLISYQPRPLEHTSRYRVNTDVLNRLWDEVSGQESVAKPVLPEDEETRVLPEAVAPATEVVKTEEKVSIKNVTPSPKIEKKGDALDGMLFYANSAGKKKSDELISIRDKMQKGFHITMDDKRWERFIEFVWGMEQKGQKVEQFIKWALDEGFDPIYWPPEKMKTLWPRAFMKKEAVKIDDNFVKYVPPSAPAGDSDGGPYVPMPKSLTSKMKPE